MKQKFQKKAFCFWDNCISIGIVKLSLLRRGYFSSAANVLQAVPRFDMSITETFPNSIDLAVINECDKIAVIKISAVLWHVYDVACRWVLRKATF